MDRDLHDSAARLLEFVHASTALPMIVCDETGTIVLAADRRRIGTRHAVAARIVAGEMDESFVSAADVERDPRMKEGCNRVILLDGRRAGSFGLAGPLEVAQPVTRIASAVIGAWVTEERRQRQLRAAAQAVHAGVAQVAARAASLAGEAATTATGMRGAADEATAKLERSSAIVRTVGDIARKSRILSVNGSVEASRAGNEGRAFGVVAREMLQLAEDARGAAGQIASTLEDVARAIGDVRDAIGRSAGLAQTQADALSEVRTIVDALQRSVAELVADAAVRRGGA